MIEHPPMSMLPDQDGLRREAFESYIDRRTLIAAAVVGGVVSRATTFALEMDQALPHFLYPGSETRIVPVGEATQAALKSEGRFDRRIWFNGGIGQDESLSRPLAEQLARAPYKRENMNYSAYSQQGLDIGQMTDEFQRFAASADKLETVTNSMSFLTICNIAAESTHRSRNMPTLRPEQPLESLTLCSSPTDIDDVYYGDIIRQFVERFEPTGTMSQKFIVKALDKAVNHDKHHLQQLIEEAAGELFDHVSPRLWISQFYQVVHTNAMQLARDGSLNGFIGPGTRIGYAMPRAFRQDKVVRVDQACQKAEALAAELDCPFDVFLLDDAGHADINRLAQNDKYHRWAQKDKATPI